MFASQDNGTVRKIFQKPNILRRTQAKRETARHKETREEEAIADSVVKKHPALEVARIPVQINRINTNIIETATPFVTLQADVPCFHSTPKLELLSSPKHEVQENNTFTLFGRMGDEVEQATLNIDSFLVESPKKQGGVVSNEYATHKLTEVESKWCLNFMSEDSKDIITPTFYDGSQINILNNDIVNTDNITPKFEIEPNLSQESSEAVRQSYIQNCLNSRVIKYKCDTPNCSKSFWNEARLQKHKLIHLRQKTTTSIIECPVKNVDSDGAEQRCGQLFPTRDQLLKHLNEDHVPEDASYRCTRCSRRFWWATGMRTHEQSPCTRAPLSCTWPGCGRVFRQPCRLREHARAHTGDRPYPCTFPNCGWAFRSASKLVRHARRHTDERRHECGVCGRAFLRREHLRDHAAHVHAPPRPPRPCTHQGCEETFENLNLLYLHLKKVHSVERPKPARRRAPRSQSSHDDILLMTLANETSIPLCGEPTPDEIETFNATTLIMPEEAADYCVVNDEVMEGAAEEGGRCARTHLPYPLRTYTDQTFTIEDDTQVEQSEGSESNIYTVRSDLFLHGNVLINEDSEFIIRESSTRASETADTAEQLEGLGLIDSHPTIDLMQEELMYGDAAVDESSFRVFLLNGEELS